MSQQSKQVKEPISKDTIFRVMLYATFIVSALFFLKNVVTKSLQGSIVIGICMAVFAVIIIGMRSLNADIERQQFVVSMSILFLVFIISMNSGESYSDDFPLYLAVIGLTGLYLRPKYTLTQMILSDILLLMQYILHPEKAENLSQFILCMATFTLAAIMFYLTIKRGRAFIERSQARAEEAERLLEMMATVGDELQKNFEDSSEKFENLDDADRRLGDNAEELKRGSLSITQGAREVSDVCEGVQDKMQVTEKQIDELNKEVKTFENALADNSRNMDEMNRQMESVKNTVREANDVFKIMNQQMQEISVVTEQLNSISSNTTMLALNASIEAARAGQMGAGFAVVASKVQELAVDSNKCSAQVAGVVELMQGQIQKTSRQLMESTNAIDGSIKTLEGLQNGFDRLTEQFDSLYGNIEAQNSNVNQVDAIFEQLKSKISEMSEYSEENQSAVEAIAEAMIIYKDNMKAVIDDTMQVHELSESMLNITKETKRA